MKKNHISLKKREVAALESIAESLEKLVLFHASPIWDTDASGQIVLGGAHQQVIRDGEAAACICPAPGIPNESSRCPIHG